MVYSDLFQAMAVSYIMAVFTSPLATQGEPARPADLTNPTANMKRNVTYLYTL